MGRYRLAMVQTVATAMRVSMAVTVIHRICLMSPPPVVARPVTPASTVSVTARTIQGAGVP